MPPDANRLGSSTSPYLLQHAHNPVHWMPWGDDAIREARTRGVPIFLSIGYSTCYWCHVMERESFEDQPTADLMNARFVCVKVDREERPDVDDLYMAATVAFAGHGGWPMSVFLEPERLRPFYCGTYYPPAPAHGRPSFSQLLTGIAEAWHAQREQVIEQSESLAGAVREQLEASGEPTTLGPHLIEQSLGALVRTADRVQGGFGGAPKFPQASLLRFLLEAQPLAADDATKSAIGQTVRLTLDRMAAGGIHDHVGGGFHRYAVDATWTVPHFEKMLYDNAQLARLYAAAGAFYDDPWYRRVARRTAWYVSREMTDRDGGFHSAQDAEVDRREGLNYLWTREQLDEVLGAEDGAWAARVYGVDAGPNFKDPHHPDEVERSVLRLEQRPETTAEREGMSVDGFYAKLDGVHERLLRARDAREQPGQDDKVLAAWNGMMIEALADCSRLLDLPECMAAAERAAEFLIKNLVDDAGRVRRSWRGGELGPEGVLEDSAMLAQGLLALEQTDGPFTRHARRILEQALQDFGDGQGGVYDARDREDLFLRGRSTNDGATPCGVGVFLHAWIELADRSGAEKDRDRVLALLASLSAPVAASPISTINTTRALLRVLSDDRYGRTGVLDAHAEATSGAPRPRAHAGPRADSDPVEVYAGVERVAVGEDPVVFEIELRIADGFHVLSAEPGEAAEGLVPTRVLLVHGSGVRVYADYPTGTPYGTDDELRVYTGRVRFRVVLTRDGDAAGRPIVGVVYQACTDTECYEPRTVELDVSLDLTT